MERSVAFHSHDKEVEYYMKRLRMEVQGQSPGMPCEAVKNNNPVHDVLSTSSNRLEFVVYKRAANRPAAVSALALFSS